jgi:hypothetical protein
MGNVWRSYTHIRGDEGLPKTTFPMASMSRGSKCHVNSSRGGWWLVRSPHITSSGTFSIPKGRCCITKSRLIIRSGLMKHGTPRFVYFSHELLSQYLGVPCFINPLRMMSLDLVMQQRPFGIGKVPELVM